MGFHHNTRPRTIPFPDWEGYLVLNADNVVLGVYGSALREAAIQQRDLIKLQHPWTKVVVVGKTLPKRPSVGDSLTNDTAKPGR